MRLLTQKIFIGVSLFSALSCNVDSQNETQTLDEARAKIEKSKMTESKEVPQDIIRKLKIDFKDEDDFQEALAIILLVRADVLNVGWIQLSRSMIIIANGDLNKLKEIINNQYHGDPRDIIMEMMRMPEIKNDNGMTPFR